LAKAKTESWQAANQFRHKLFVAIARLTRGPGPIAGHGAGLKRLQAILRAEIAELERLS